MKDIVIAIIVLAVFALLLSACVVPVIIEVLIDVKQEKDSR